jgi:HEPN domain-containing protein
MLGSLNLIKIAKARLQDAEALLRCKRYDGAVYVCGYALELRLKARICRVLHWEGYPDTRSEFQDYASFRTHDLDVLLRLAGAAARMKEPKYLADWSAAAGWDPEARYKPIGSATRQGTEAMIESVKRLMKAL